MRHVGSGEKPGLAAEPHNFEACDGKSDVQRTQLNKRARKAQCSQGANEKPKKLYLGYEYAGP